MNRTGWLTGMALAAASAMLTGCAVAMGQYGRYSAAMQVGYTDTEVQPGLFLVRYYGNNLYPADRTMDFTLLRAAEICLERGRNYMSINDVDAQMRPDAYSTSTTTVVPPSETSTVVHSGTVSPALLFNPMIGLVVSCREAQDGKAWDAGYLSRTIRTKYSMS